MSGQAARQQAVFNSLELGPRLHERSELKYFNTGLAYAQNVEALPQGGFAVRAGLRHIGTTLSTAARIVDFQANNGTVFDIVYGAATAQAWGQSAMIASYSHPYSEAQARTMDHAQALDTLLTFHEDVAPQRALFNPSGNSFSAGDAPLTNIPTYDYGATYTNGVAAVWDIDFQGLDGTPLGVYALTLNGVETLQIKYTTTNSTNAARIFTALEQTGLLKAGFTVTAGTTGVDVRVTFSGAGNIGDDWALSGRCVNKADAAIVTYKTTAGVAPGENIVSATRGWPRCGTFYQQRLLMGGLKSLPGSWMASLSGEYFNFTSKIKEANGSFVAIMDVPGGVAVRKIVNNTFLLIMTSNTNYWIAGSQDGLKKTEPPKHIPASDHGIAAGVPVIQNEGAAVYAHSSGDFIGEMRYTDTDGNYVSLDVSLLAYHLVDGVTDLAARKKADQQACNQIAVVNGSGALNIAYVLREQEITGFARVNSGCAFKAVNTNGRNELAVVTERGGSRRLERFEAGLLLDAAVTVTNAPATVEGLSHLNGLTVWALADGHVFGPYVVSGGQITLPRAASIVTVGTWTPPVITTLPLPRTRGDGIVVKRKGRIHTLHVEIEDTTSLAIAANGGPARDVDLARYGAVMADQPELTQGVSGTVKISGLQGWSDLPQITITQTRPGRLTVKSVSIEAKL